MDNFEPLEAYDEKYTSPAEELGRGASGVVRRAERKSDGVGVAVKIIDVRALRMMNGQFSISRLCREVQVMLGLKHKNIVELYGVYSDGNQVRLVMELVNGIELFEEILSRGKFSEGEAKPVFGALCAAVSYMHGKGIIHRDLKPENVLVSEDVVKVVDFGLSKLVAAHKGGSAARTLVGTPSYLAPEIEDENHDYDEKVDAWSIGVTLYVMLIARFPVYKRSQDGNIIGLEICPEFDLSPQAQSLLRRLLDPNPNTRCSVAAASKDVWLQTAVAACPSNIRGQLQCSSISHSVPSSSHNGVPHTAPRVENTQREANTSPMPIAGLASAQAALAAAAALRLPDEMRRAGLVYHERALASRNLATKLRGAAGLVLETLDDLALAVEAKKPEAAADILASVKRWTAELASECATAKTQNLSSMHNLADFAKSILKDTTPSLLAIQQDPQRQIETNGGSMIIPPPETDTENTIQEEHRDHTSSPRQQILASEPDFDLTNDDEVLELLLPVTADDIVHATLGTSHTQNSNAVVPNQYTVTTSNNNTDPHASIGPVLKCLGELHVVFSRMELFWSKVEVSLDSILRRNEALTTLLKFADEPQLKTRFDNRLHQFRQFWIDLERWTVESPGIISASGTAQHHQSQRRRRTASGSSDSGNI
eukprot:CAMPEP_0197292150 /NCGR_PEP_ID=MMETSP0890-20130614/21453_1 /TAXON_ID=44058 ORGANISM="Aureoumbra lagunensis, Strain CCMP1510" /NCGR_SAMPLE_ID=MMETSP0890 /ASSEMBLY_ACC=CAM_ASM_000533 /LENGTH=653 /DNA_ID=CAMNT_0042765819 /DNA_START=122 /DNA_END=2083 /DNA_ORIENTATION=-